MANTLTKDVILNLEISDSEAVTSIGQLIKRMDELKAKQKLLNSQQKDWTSQLRKGEITQAQYAEKMQYVYSELAKVASEMKLTKDSMSAYQKELNNNIIQEKAAADSIEAMRAKLVNMRKDYEQLSKAERDNPLVGGEQLKNISDLTEELAKLEAAQKDFRRNVGNYGSAFDASSESLTRFGGILQNIFGGNGVIGKAATVVVGFGRNLQQMSKDAADMASSIVDSASKTQSSAQILDSTAQTINNVGTAAESTTKTVQGFGKALYETETVEEGAAKATSDMAKATGGISGAFQKAGVAVKSFGKTLWALLSNPYVAAFAAIVVVLMKLVDQFKKNDIAMTALQRVFAAFKPILDVINLLFTKLVDILGKALDGIANLMQKIASYIPFLKDYAAAEDDIVVATDKLEEAENQYTVNHSKRERDISELNAKAADSQKYTFKERKKFMEQAAELEKQDLKEARTNATEKLRLTRQKAAADLGYAEFNEEVYAKLSDERKKELADLEAAVYGAEKAYNDGMRNINKRKSTFTKQEESERKQRLQAAAAAAKERKKLEKEALDSLEDMWLKSIANLQDKEYALAAQTYKRQIADLKEKLATEKNLTIKAREAINRQIVLLEADMQIELGRIRKEQRQKQYQDELNNLKTYYATLLKGMTTEEAKLQLNLEINKIDTNQLLDSIKKPLDDAEKVVKDAMNDLNGDFEKGIESLDYNELAAKYKDVWDAMGLDDTQFSDNIAKMNAMIKNYQDQLLKEQTIYENRKNAIINASQKEEERLRLESVKSVKETNDKKYSLEVKHQSIISQMQRENDLELYRNNEVEKAKIMQSAAEERLKIAQDEYNRLAQEREKYTDEELTYMYGSVEAYNLKLDEANLKVIESNNAVKQSMRDVTAAQMEEKKKMIAAVTSIADALNNVAGSFQDLFNTLAEDNEKYSDFATALAMMQILISSAVAIASAIQGAAEAAAATGPAAPFTLAAYIIEMVAIVAGGVASAVATLKQAKEAKKSKPQFAEGGLVGNRTTKRKDDTVDAKLSEGEYVIKSEIVSKYGVPFFDFINYGKKMFPNAKSNYAEGGQVVIPQSAIEKTNEVSMSDFKNAMVEAFDEMPNPIVSVAEITNKQKRVQVKEKIATSK